MAGIEVRDPYQVKMTFRHEDEKDAAEFARLAVKSVNVSQVTIAEGGNGRRVVSFTVSEFPL